MGSKLEMSDECAVEVDGDKLGFIDKVGVSDGFAFGDRDGAGEGRLNSTSLGDMLGDELGPSDEYDGLMERTTLGKSEEYVGFKLGLPFGSSVGLPGSSDDG